MRTSAERSPRGCASLRSTVLPRSLGALHSLLWTVTWALSVTAAVAQNGAHTGAAERHVIELARTRQPFKIVLTGDSTVATEGGWGPGFCQLLTRNVTCVDLAKNGRSTKSYIDEGLWQGALDEHGQYLFMQFGHNDQKDDPARHADAGGAYAANLRRFIHDVRAQGGIAIVVTPLSRRNYRDGALVTDDGLGDYAAAAKRVAAEEHVTVVDLLSLSRALLNQETQAEADTLNATVHADATAENGSAAKPDRTHLNSKGKAIFGRMVADDVIRSEVELRPDVKASPGGARPVPAGAPSTDGH